jgi:ribosomal protein S27AE
MYEELETHADYNKQDVSEMARNLLEEALSQYQPQHGLDNKKHSYGDCACPRCGDTHALRLRWWPDPDAAGGAQVTCGRCGYEDEVLAFRAARVLPYHVRNVWHRFTYTRDAESDYRDTGEVQQAFREFLQNPLDTAESNRLFPDGENIGDDLRERFGDGNIAEAMAEGGLDKLDDERTAIAELTASVERAGKTTWEGATRAVIEDYHR